MTRLARDAVMACAAVMVQKVAEVARRHELRAFQRRQHAYDRAHAGR